MLNWKKNIPGVKLFQPVRIHGVNNIQFGENVIIDSFTYIYANNKMRIGNNVFIASFVFINGADFIEIGDFVGIYHGVKIYSGTDDFKDGGFGNPAIDDKYRMPKRAPISIGRFVNIGANSVILPGVAIGEGASVGACSVISRNLDPWGIYIHNKKVGERNRKNVLENYKGYLEDMGG